jgi:hypothetical protein
MEKTDLTNELLFRLCVGQRLLSTKEYIWFRSLIPPMPTHPCELCEEREELVAKDCGKCKFIPQNQAG